MNEITFMQRFSLIPGQEDNYSELWKREAKIMEKYGYQVINAFVETGKGMRYRLKTNELLDSGDEKIFTCLYSCEGDIREVEQRFNEDREAAAVIAEKKKFILNDVSMRQVKPQIIKRTSDESLKKMIIMRRYNVQGDWQEFLDIWRRIVPVREKYGFPCLFAIEDVEQRLFDWAFTYDGNDFGIFMKEGQAGYYSDPQRVELETINNYLEEIRLTPARCLLIP